LHEHLANLAEHGLLHQIDRPINKDTELHPLVRWQFCGGIEEKDRKGFLFTNIVDGKNRDFAGIQVAVGVLSANPEIYAIVQGLATLVGFKGSPCIKFPCPTSVQQFGILP